MTEASADKPTLDISWQKAEQSLGFLPPPACREGIEANLKLLEQHARVLDAFIQSVRT